MVSGPAKEWLDRLAQMFTVSDADLDNITQAFGQAYLKGLQVPSQPIVMGPSWVTHDPTGNETGKALTLELSWNYVRIAVVTLEGNRSVKNDPKIFDISEDMMRSDAPVFFGFLASCMSQYIEEKSLKNSPLPLGFIFPFAFEKENMNHGKLLAWSKGFNINGAVGKCVVDLLQEAMNKQGLRVKCEAIVNDTVAVLLAQSYLEAPCLLSAIYSAGTNGSYMEYGASITKIPNFQGSQMMINTEWGALNDPSLLHPTPWDNQVDKESANPNHYRFQKLSSWFYLGEICRFILLDLVNKQWLFKGKATVALKRHGSYAAFHMFQIEDADKLSTVKTLICDLFDYQQSDVSDEDAEIVQQVAGIVAVRSGRLLGCPTAAVIKHTGYHSEGPNANVERINIAADGEFFLGSKQFETRLKDSIGAVLGHSVRGKLAFHHVKGRGFVGGALAALEGAKAIQG